MSCGSPLAIAGAMAEANEAVKKALADGLGVSPTELQAAVNAALQSALPSALNSAVPPVVADQLNALSTSIISTAVAQATQTATTIAVVQATQAAQTLVNALSQQLATAQSTIATLQATITALRRTDIPYNQLRPKNGTFVSVHSVSFAGKVLDFKFQFDGAGSAQCSVPINQNFQPGDDILITISGANTATRNMRTNLYVERI